MNRSRSLSVVGFVFSVAYSSAAFSETLDWTPLLEPWEEGCGESGELIEFRKNVAIYSNSTGLPEIGSVVLPEKYKDALGVVYISGREDEYSLFKVSAKYGSYYNIPVNSFGFYVGHSNGINISYVELDAALEEASEQLSEVNFKEEEHASGPYQAKLLDMPNSNNSMLMCDRSM